MLGRSQNCIRKGLFVLDGEVALNENFSEVALHVRPEGLDRVQPAGVDRHRHRLELRLQEVLALQALVRLVLVIDDVRPRSPVRQRAEDLPKELNKGFPVRRIANDIDRPSQAVANGAVQSQVGSPILRLNDFETVIHLRPRPLLEHAGMERSLVDVDELLIAEVDRCKRPREVCPGLNKLMAVCLLLLQYVDGRAILDVVSLVEGANREDAHVEVPLLLDPCGPLAQRHVLHLPQPLLTD